MDQRTGELSELLGEGTSDLSSDDLVYVRLSSDPTAVHRAASTAGLITEPRMQRTRCGVMALVSRVLWTSEPPNCVVCLATEER